jgi:hypothetical protein
MALLYLQKFNLANLKLPTSFIFFDTDFLCNEIDALKTPILSLESYVRLHIVWVIFSSYNLAKHS